MRLAIECLLWMLTVVITIMALSQFSRAQTATNQLPMISPPNFVLVMCDDCGHNHFNRDVMPNVFQHIVDRGVRFQKATTPHPLCAPARATYHTGMLAHNHGLKVCNDVPGVVATHLWTDYVNGGWVQKETGPRLQAAGYYTALVGKYMPFVSQWKSVMPLGGWDMFFARTGLGYNDQEWSVNGNLRTLPGYSTAILRTRFKLAVDEAVAQSKPFFIHLNPFNPHRSGTPGEMSYPPHRENFTRGQPIPARPDQWLTGNGKPTALNNAVSVGANSKAVMQKIHSERVKSMKAFDDYFRQMVNHLIAQDVYSSTVFLFTTDNANFDGAHAMGSGKMGPYCANVCIPFAMAGPGIVPQTSNAMIQTQDVLPTIMDLAGIPHDPTIDGESFADILTSTSCVPWRRWAYAESWSSGNIWRNQSIGWFSWRWRAVYSPAKTFIRWPNLPGLPEEAYSDPYQVANDLASLSPGAIATRRNRIAAYATCTGASCHAIEKLTCN